GLERLNVFCLPAFGALHHVELHRLPFLKAAEALRLNRGVMNENVFTVLTADEAKTLCIVEPLYCSLFHEDTSLFCVDLRWMVNRSTGRLAIQARSAGGAESIKRIVTIPQIYHCDGNLLAGPSPFAIAQSGYVLVPIRDRPLSALRST